MKTTSGDINGEYKKVNFTPYIEYKYGYINYSYRGTLRYPTIRELQPVVNNSDPLYIYSGNPNLKPEYNNSLNLSNLGFNSFMGYNISASLIQNKIIQKRIIDDFGVTHSEMLNVNGVYNASISLRKGQMRLAKRVELSTTVNVKYLRGVGYTNTVRYRSNSYYGGANVYFSYRHTYLDAKISLMSNYSNSLFSDKSLTTQSVWNNSIKGYINWALPFGFNFTSDCTYTQYIGYKSDNEPTVIFNMEICKSAFNNKFIFSIKGNDILDQTKNLKISYADNYIEETRTNMLGRYIMFNVTFKF